MNDRDDATEIWYVEIDPLDPTVAQIVRKLHRVDVEIETKMRADGNSGSFVKVDVTTLSQIAWELDFINRRLDDPSKRIMFATFKMRTDGRLVPYVKPHNTAVTYQLPITPRSDRIAC